MLWVPAATIMAPGGRERRCVHDAHPEQMRVVRVSSGVRHFRLRLADSGKISGPPTDGTTSEATGEQLESRNVLAHSVGGAESKAGQRANASD
jgi:hypothetical protein